jgi:site-specific DNA recombinase
VTAAAVNRVLITAPDRLARNYVHQVLLLEELERFGCLVEFLDRPMSRDPHDQLLLQIRGAVAEYERTLIVERMRAGTLGQVAWRDALARDALALDACPLGVGC